MDASLGPQSSAKRRAIVIGGSLAGLLAARVLWESFGEVIIVERDELSDAPEPRKGVPQSRHFHGLLKRGEDIFEQLFPGLMASLVQAGATRLDFGRDVMWHHRGAWKIRCDSGLLATFLSRPLLESAIRRRVAALPDVQILSAHEVTALTATPDHRRITGVMIRRKGQTGNLQQLAGDLVLDAGGRGSLVPKWLTELGYERPGESKVVVHINYATQLLRRVEPSPFPWKVMAIYSDAPGGKRFGALSPIEGGRWIATLGGLLNDRPPLDPAGYLEYARTLPDDALFRALVQCEPVDKIIGYSFPFSIRRYYERLSRFPERLLPIGDALCSMNPLYGQGMVIAALEAMALLQCLRQQELATLSRRYMAQVKRIIDPAWFLAMTEDFRYPEVEGKRPPGFSLLTGLLDRIHRAAASDEEVLRRFLRAMHMIGSPAELLRPRMLLRIFAPASRPRPKTA